ncbi:hypothetical protein SprV_0100402200 [Sparganum proliferum]
MSSQLDRRVKQDLVVETIELLLREKYHETENRVGHVQIIQLMKLCLKTYFTFDGTIYEQVKGTPMGSAISGLMAEAVLQRLESLVSDTTDRNSGLVMWMIPSSLSNGIRWTSKEHPNAVISDVQFTMEEEENNRWPPWMSSSVAKIVVA